MSLLSRFFEARALTPQQVFGIGADFLPGKQDSGFNITQNNALGDTALWAAVTLLAADISSLPVIAYRQVGDVREPLAMQPAWLEQPDPLDLNVSWVDHISQVMLSGLLDGNAFVWCEPSVFRAERLEVLNPATVSVKREGRTRVYEVRTGTSIGQRLTAADLIHINFFRKPGLDRGTSPIDEHAEAIGLSRAAEKFSARFFGAGATMSGLVELPAGVEYTDEDKKGLRADFAKTHGGWRNSYLLGVLTGGAKWVETSVKPKDSQLIELRTYQVEDMARLYGIPPYMVGSQQPGAVAYASVEQRSIDYVTHCLNARYLGPLQAGYKRLVPGDARLAIPGSNTFISFDVTGLLKGDVTARAAYYKSMFEIGAFSPDDILHKEGLPPVPDGRGKEHFYPANYVSLPRPGQMVPAPATGTAVPADIPVIPKSTAA